jgi:hypothetical protein
MKRREHIESFLEHTRDFNETNKIEENSWDGHVRKIIEDSYNDYMSLNNDREREIIARQIARAASGFIRNGSKIEDWMEVFKGEDIVISKLKEL